MSVVAVGDCAQSSDLGVSCRKVQNPLRWVFRLVPQRSHTPIPHATQRIHHTHEGKSHNMALFLEDNGHVFLILEDPFNAVSSHYCQLQYNHNYNLDGNQAILTGVSETSCCCSGEKEKGQGEIIRWIVRKGSTGNIHGNALTRENHSLGHAVPLLPFPIQAAMVKFFIKEYLFRQL